MDPEDQEQNARMAASPTGRLLSVAAQAVEQNWHAGLKELGLTHAGMIALSLLDEGPLTQVELAHRARVRPQTMSRTIDTLAAAGFVRRTATADRRQHLVETTAAGRHAMTQTWSLESRLFPDIEDIAELRRALLQIIRDAR